jgi:hypothetical protein
VACKCFGWGEKGEGGKGLQCTVTIMFWLGVILDGEFHYGGSSGRRGRREEGGEGGSLLFNIVGEGDTRLISTLSLSSNTKLV